MPADAFETVAAISTARGKGGVAMIRISGEAAHDIAARVFRPARGKSLSEYDMRRAVYGRIISEQEEIDTGICTLYNKASYTGENMAEICCHGGTAVTSAVLYSVLRAGARQALAGEFTRRAFINGKITLTEAEAIGSLIDADTESRRRLAADAAAGALKRRCSEISDSLRSVMSALYAAVDYPEEDIGDEGEQKIAGAVVNAAKNVDSLLSTYKRGRAVMEGVRTVICGSPNCGKSSLYNALAGEDRAIVTSIEGTTRDILRDTVDIGGVTLLLCDTAGLRDSEDEVEKIGVEKAKNAMENAEILLCVYDSTRILTDDEKNLIQSDKKDTIKIALINKTDLPRGISESDMELIRSMHDATVEISAKNGTGIEQTGKIIGEMYGAAEGSSGEAVVWEARQAAELAHASELLHEAADALNAGEAPDCACTLCESALAALGMVDGRDVTESIVNEIFAKFCVGK